MKTENYWVFQVIPKVNKYNRIVLLFENTTKIAAHQL